MPELPEVELVGRYLRPHLVGRRIARVTVTRPSYFFLTSPAILRRRLPNATFEALERRGKYLVAQLSTHDQLLLHLGMTGQLILLVAKKGRQFTPDAHSHLILEFDDHGPGLCFRDPRKFGKVKLLSLGETDPRLLKLGADALKLSSEVLFVASRKRRAAIKTMLLDQTVTAGIGNIYADESLFFARIHPERPASSLSRDECERLAEIVKKVLRRSIRAGGSSIDDYIHPDGSDGRFQAQHRVYGRQGLPCQQCKSAIERIVIGQRSAHYCPQCQRLHA
ncbi:MAG: bifunctional DNA-formamidopyrimidine glycosylase/DNA-(apurinic or apyrimidinic site) lyase [Myxococcales bacterium]